MFYLYPHSKGLLPHSRVFCLPLPSIKGIIDDDVCILLFAFTYLHSFCSFQTKRRANTTSHHHNKVLFQLLITLFGVLTNTCKDVELCRKASFFQWWCIYGETYYLELLLTWKMYYCNSRGPSNPQDHQYSCTFVVRIVGCFLFCHKFWFCCLNFFKLDISEIYGCLVSIGSRLMQFGATVDEISSLEGRWCSVKICVACFLEN